MPSYAFYGQGCADRLLRPEHLAAIPPEARCFHFGSYAMVVQPVGATQRALVERELMATLREGTDRRTVQLKVLPAGRRLLKRAPGPLAGVLPQALVVLETRTLARLERDLAQLLPHLKIDARAANIPLGQR